MPRFRKPRSNIILTTNPWRAPAFGQMLYDLITGLAEQMLDNAGLKGILAVDNGPELRGRALGGRPKLSVKIIS